MAYSEAETEILGPWTDCEPQSADAETQTEATETEEDMFCSETETPSPRPCADSETETPCLQPRPPRLSWTEYLARRG